MFKCIIFDLDGTLVDSELLNARAFSELTDPLGLSSEAVRDLHRGRKLSEIIDDLRLTHGVTVPDRFVESYRSRVEVLYHAELSAFDGVAEALQSLSVPLCIASNAPLEKIITALAVTNLSHFFGQNLFSAYEVGSWKPSPDLFLAAAKAMNAQPHECLVVEDSEPGVQAAGAAGMMCLQFDPELGEADQRQLAFRNYSDFSRAFAALSGHLSKAQNKKSN